MLYKAIAKLIHLGRLDGLADRIDMLYALGKLTGDEYKELTRLLDEA